MIENFLYDEKTRENAEEMDKLLGVLDEKNEKPSCNQDADSLLDSIMFGTPMENEQKDEITPSKVDP